MKLSLLNYKLFEKVLKQPSLGLLFNVNDLLLKSSRCVCVPQWELVDVESHRCAEIGLFQVVADPVVKSVECFLPCVTSDTLDHLALSLKLYVDVLQCFVLLPFFEDFSSDCALSFSLYPGVLSFDSPL